MMDKAWWNVEEAQQTMAQTLEWPDGDSAIQRPVRCPKGNSNICLEEASSTNTVDQDQSDGRSREPRPWLAVGFPRFDGKVPLEFYLAQVKLAILHND